MSLSVDDRATHQNSGSFRSYSQRFVSYRNITNVTVRAGSCLLRCITLDKVGNLVDDDHTRLFARAARNMSQIQTLLRPTRCSNAINALYCRTLATLINKGIQSNTSSSPSSSKPSTRPSSLLSIVLNAAFNRCQALSTISYKVDNRVAHITLNRPEVLNSINDKMPSELSACVGKANDDSSVHVIVLSGAGRAFCAGYDLSYYAQSGSKDAVQDMPWDSMKDYAFMQKNTEHFMSLFRSSKPTLCQVHGDALAGGSDIALCCDLIVMADEARIGYMPARVWGCPTTAMWIYRSAERAVRRRDVTVR